MKAPIVSDYVKSYTSLLSLQLNTTAPHKSSAKQAHKSSSIEAYMSLLRHRSPAKQAHKSPSIEAYTGLLRHKSPAQQTHTSRVY